MGRVEFYAAHGGGETRLRRDDVVSPTDIKKNRFMRFFYYGSVTFCHLERSEGA